MQAICELIIVMCELNLFYVCICPRIEARKVEGRRRVGTLILHSDEKGGDYTIFPETCIFFVPVITFFPFLLCK